jgi:hypothetical protein
MSLIILILNEIENAANMENKLKIIFTIKRNMKAYPNDPFY